MLNSIPDEIKTYCETQIGKLNTFKPASGGCINNGGILAGSNSTAFVKWNSAKKFPEMFTAEAKGLRLLKNAKAIDIPEVLNVYEGENYSCLILEQVETAPRSRDFWETFGRQLAALHKTTQDVYGLGHDNYMGSLKQSNDQCDSLIDFFIKSRLKPQIDLASTYLSDEDRLQFEKLFAKLPSLLIEESPALVHGDLWSGNFMVGNNGQPVLIDPAVAFSSREADLAMTRLFGGFDSKFYSSYEEVYPTAPGLEHRIDIYNLYPLLVHVNLFGQGYYRQVKSILDRFV